jgi:FkbM family methyltransferase
MSVMTTVKQLSIATGLYRPTRWLSRRIRPSQLRAFLGDVDLYGALLAPGALCFDVGANIGEKSEALLRAGAARVVAFEPNPVVLPELRARCGHWKNWTVVEAALGSAAGLATLYARRLHAQSSLLKDWQGSITGTYHVPVLTLDSAIQYFGRPFYCKIDVEGWELEVLRGLTQSLPLVSFEFHLNDQDIPKTAACLERLRGFGRSQVNISPAEASTFYLGEWERLERFLGWFPGDLKRSPAYHYGDIFVKSDEA